MKPPQSLLLLLMLAYTPLRSEPSPGLRAGTGVVDVSPEVLPFQLRSGSSEYINDPLHARSIALQSGSGRTLITLLDDIGVSREMTDAAKVAVAAKTGWKSEDMLISGTHTHTAPKGGDTSEGRIAYEKRRLEGLVDAMTKAIESL